MPEALDMLADDGIYLDTCRIRAFPFGEEVSEFVNAHELIFVIEQNRDEQMRKLLINERNFDPNKLISITYYAGLSISADFIRQRITTYYQENKLARVTEVQS